MLGSNSKGQPIQRGQAPVPGLVRPIFDRDRFYGTAGLEKAPVGDPAIPASPSPQNPPSRFEPSPGLVGDQATMRLCASMSSPTSPAPGAARSKRPAVLVTGGAGYIGSHVVLELLEADFLVVVLDNLITGLRWAVDPRAAFAEGSVEDDKLVRSLLRDHDIQAILHIAGSTVVSESIRDPLKYYRNNTAASRSLLESAVREQVHHVVFSSTAAVYRPSGPVSEESVVQPGTPYGWSKLMTEQMLAHVARSYPFNYCALRYFNVAGADPQGRAGPSGIDPTQLIDVAVAVALGKRSQVTVYGNDFATPDGTGVRDYIHVSDLAQAHVLALEELFARPSLNHVLNCGSGRGYSVLEVLDAVALEAGRPIPHAFGSRRPGDLDRVIADNRCLKELLFWQPRYDLRAIVAHALRWEASRSAARAEP
jgi:UDP-glucose 4-epimerase